MVRFLLLFFLIALNLKADFLKAEAGAGVWLVNGSGEIVYKGTPLDFEDDLGLDSSLAAYAYANFKHFIPIIPNARVEITQFGEDATKNIPAELQHEFNDRNISGNTKSKLNLNQIDIIAYYNLIDTILSADVGFGIKYYDGDIDVDGNKVNIDFPVPIIYGRLGATIPTTNIGAEIDLKYFKFSPEVHAEMYDLRIKAKATVLELALLEMVIEGGYRVHRLQILAEDNSFSDFNADIKSEVSGFFGGINITF